MSTEIRSNTELPARRTDIELVTDDHLTLVGELAEPLDRPARGTLVTLHPLPTAQGFMDSHVLKKAAARLPALADIAVLRFNFRSVTSPRGTSEGVFGDGESEGFDLRAAVHETVERGLPTPWLLGWSFGTEVALKHGLEHVAAGTVAGVVLLSPPLHRTTDDELRRWADVDVPVVALVPEHDDFLQPDEPHDASRSRRTCASCPSRARSTCGWGSGTSGRCSTPSRTWWCPAARRCPRTSRTEQPAASAGGRHGRPPLRAGQRRHACARRADGRR